METEDDLTPSLEVLERRDFIRAQDSSSIGEEREYAFKHILIRDVAYGRLPKGRRVALHVRFADWLEALLVEDELVEIGAFAGEIGQTQLDRKSTRLNSSHFVPSRMPSSA